MPIRVRRLAQQKKENEKVAASSRSISSFFSSSRNESPASSTDQENTGEKKDSTAVESQSESSVSVSANPLPPSPSVSELPQPSAKRRRIVSGHKVGFDAAWQKGRPWLIHRVEETDDGNISVMYCSLCQSFKTTGLNGSRKWVDVGCQSLRLDKVKEHEGSAQHRHSLSQSLSNTVDSMADKITTEAQTAILDAMKVLQFVISKNLPLNIFADLTDLCIEVGSSSLSKLRLAKNATYSSWDIVQELLDLLHKEVEDEMKKRVCASPCFSVMVDEVCDRTIEKHMAVCAKYIDDSGSVKTSFLSDTTLKSATADVITETIQTQIEQHDLSIHNMTGFGSDGAAVFTGKKSGVAQRLKTQNPAMVTVHCKDHRLALACRDSFKGCPEFKKTDQLLEDLHRYYKNSSVKTASLKEVQKSFQEVPLNIKQAKHHRWLSHNAAVHSIVRSYRSLIAELEAHTLTDDPVGNGILRHLKDPLNILILHFLADVLPHLTALWYFRDGDTGRLL